MTSNFSTNDSKKKLTNKSANHSAASEPKRSTVVVRTAKKTVDKTPKKRVLFVCTGNTCRSPMAEALLKDALQKKQRATQFIVSSAGLAAQNGDPMTENARAALKTLGVKASKHKAKRLTAAGVHNSDLIVCMTESHRRALAAFADKTKTIADLTGGGEVSDPFGQDLAAYLRTAEYLRYACEDILAYFDSKA